MRRLSKQDLRKIRGVKIQAAFYAALCLASCWLVAFALTGSILRALMFAVALALIGISTGQYNALIHRIHILTMGKDMENFEQWLNEEKPK